MHITDECTINQLLDVDEESLLLGIFTARTGVDPGAYDRGLYGDNGGGTGACVATCVFRR